MKLRDQATSARNMPRETRSEVPKGTSESRPSLAEIGQRAFEIHNERGGIHGCDLDDWMQAVRELGMVSYPNTFLPESTFLLTAR